MNTKQYLDCRFRPFSCLHFERTKSVRGVWSSYIFCSPTFVFLTAIWLPHGQLRVIIEANYCALKSLTRWKVNDSIVAIVSSLTSLGSCRKFYIHFTLQNKQEKVWLYFFCSSLFEVDIMSEIEPIAAWSSVSASCIRNRRHQFSDLIQFYTPWIELINPYSPWKH